MWIDSHCHITHEKIVELGTPNELIGAADASGVKGMLVINCRIVEELPRILSAIENHPNVWCTLGTHPHEASRQEEQELDIAELEKLIAANQKIAGIGESGLDYHYHFADRDDQQASFRKHIRLCLSTGLPLIVHAREADDDIIRIISEETGGRGLPGVMHCFSSSPKMAYEALDLGFHISFSGMITFKKSAELRAIAKNIPLDRLLVETDAPYLAPEPYRGKLNQPAYVRFTGNCLAEIHDITPDMMAKTTTENFFALFKRCRAN